MDLIFLKPILKETIWGGRRLKDEFHYQEAGDHTGECWGISAHKHGDCMILGGRYDGMALSNVWRHHQELFGYYGGNEFPLLAKIIDAKEDLSIQVHPDDEYAAANEHGALGKTECWYVLDCPKDATIMIGTQANDKKEVQQLIEAKRYRDLIREVPITKGDFYQIEPGCIHAIKGGSLIFETQQSSDLTYRVYDYDRLSNGTKRELHIKQSIAVIRAPFKALPSHLKIEKIGNTVKTTFIRCPYYEVRKYKICEKYEELFDAAFANISVINGAGKINGRPIEKGTHFIVPNGYGLCQFKGELELICSMPGNRKQQHVSVI